MKISRTPDTIRFAALVLGLLAWAPSVCGQSLDLSPFTGRTTFLSDPPARIGLEREDAPPSVVSDARFEPAWTNGLAADLNVNGRLVVRLEGSLAMSSITAVDGPDQDGVDFYAFGATFLFTPTPSRRIGPFAGLGIGALRFDYAEPGLRSHTDLAAGATAGLAYRSSNRIRVRVELDNRIARFDSRLEDGETTWLDATSLRMGISLRIADWR